MLERFMMTFKGIKPKIDSSVFVASGAKVIGEVSIKEHSSVWFNCVVRGDVNAIKIGSYVNIQDLSTVHVHHRSFDENGNIIDSGLECVIEDYVTIGHNCVIHACHIEKECLVGMNSVIMDGARIGHNSIIGAGSVVSKGKVFPPNSLILGAPARVVRALNDDEIKSLKEHALMYAKLKDEYLLS